MDNATRTSELHTATTALASFIPAHLFEELLSKISGGHVLQAGLASHFAAHVTVEVGPL